MRVLLASYDGVADGPGRSQTLPYVRGLARRDHEMALLSFERPDVLADASRLAEVEAMLDGVRWTRLAWRKNPARDLVTGLAALRRAAREHRAELVHARGYVPAFLAQRLALPFLFDMRGFWPDERVDGGLWSRASLGYRLWKRIERTLCRDARAIVVLTERARGELRRLELAPPATPVAVIPTCVDLDRFRPFPEDERPPECRGEARRYLVFGSTGTWYLREETLDLAALALRRDPGAILHVLTRDAPGPLVEGLDRRGVRDDRRLVRAIAPGEAARWISGARAAFVLLRSTWSKGASCPTKLGELLACGVPVVMSAGIGDGDRQLAGGEAGVILVRHDETGYRDALASLDALWDRGPTAVAPGCRALAEREFALPIGVARYDASYREALSR